MFVCIRFATMLGRHSANAPPNCSIQNKKIRNSEYYKEKKESLKAKKVRYDFKIELDKEEEGRLESLKMKIASIKKELHLDNKLVPAANARFMEILVDNWLIHSAKTEANGLETAHFVDFDSMQSVIEEETNASSPPESFQDSYIKTQLHSESRENDEIYLVCGSALERLFRHFIDGNDCVCKCGKSLDFATFKVQRITKNNHRCKVTVECKAEEGHTLEWFSSSIFAGKYYANLR